MPDRFGLMACCFPEYEFARFTEVSARLGASYLEAFAFQLKPEKISPSDARRSLDQHQQELRLVIAENLDPADADTTLTRLADDLARWKEIGLTRFVTLRAKRSEDREAFLALLKRAAELVSEAGWTPLTQNHQHGMIESPAELKEAAATGVGLHFDTQQFHNAGHAARLAWEELGREVVHVHLGDRDADRKPASFGEGVIRLDHLLRRMHGLGYRGGITLEPELGRGDDAIPHVEAALRYVREVLEPLDACGNTAAGHAYHHRDDIPPVKADWGQLHWVSSAALIAGCGQTLGFVTVAPGQRNPAHYHPEDQEVIVIQTGACRHRCGEKEVTLQQGDVLFIPAGQPHQALNEGTVPCEMLVLYPTGARGFVKVDDLFGA